MDCKGIVKPDIVFFGESLPAIFFDLISKVFIGLFKDFPKCDLMIVMGTSLQVQPFASLVYKAPKNCSIFLINNTDVVPKVFLLNIIVYG